MGKRLNRYSGSKIKAILPSLIGEEASFILVNGSTYHGVIERMDEVDLVFKDYRSKKQVFKIQDVVEIITDIGASF